MEEKEEDEEKKPKNRTKKKADDGGAKKDDGGDGGAKKDDGGAKKDDGPVPVVYKMNCTCEGCLEKIKRRFRYFDGVKIVKADRWANELTVTGKMDSNKVRDKLADITKKNVEIVSPQPKKDASAAADGKPREKKSDERK